MNKNDKRKAIMLVDDHGIIVQTARDLLNKQGYTAFPFSNTRAAYDFFKSQHHADFGLVFIATDMGPRSWSVLVKQIKAISPSVRVVLMTETDIPKDKFQNALNGIEIDGVIAAPFDADRMQLLFDTVDRLLE